MNTEAMAIAKAVLQQKNGKGVSDTVFCSADIRPAVRRFGATALFDGKSTKSPGWIEVCAQAWDRILTERRLARPPIPAALALQH